jgi:hypothetical protein
MNKNLPEEYKPFDKVWVCNNDFDKGHILFLIDSNPVFLIGKGSKPNEMFFWLKVPNNEGEKKDWKDVVVKNIPKDSKYSLAAFEFGNEVAFNDIPLIQYRLDNERLVINMINLKPIGLNIYGSLSSLNISGNSFTKNSFENVYTMVGIGK